VYTNTARMNQPRLLLENPSQYTHPHSQNYETI